MIYGSYALGIGYGSCLIAESKLTNNNTNDDTSVGAGVVITVLFSIIFGCFSLGQAAPNIKNMVEARNAGKDYLLLLYKHKRKQYSYTNWKHSRYFIYYLSIFIFFHNSTSFCLR